ncbi:MAG: GNAT family N-acetyltransferase [Sphaerochaetaceae bacterium]
MKTIIETPRLLLRELSQDDYACLSAILQDTQTMYAYEGAFNDTETQKWLAKMLTRYKTDGFGLWAAIQKDTGIMIGQAGLTWQTVDNRQVLEVGYLFNRNYWGEGYAIEAAKACKEYAFTELHQCEVFSIIRDTNIASMNVAIRNGMLIRGRFIKHYRGLDMPHLIFSARKQS